MSNSIFNHPMVQQALSVYNQIEPVFGIPNYTTLAAALLPNTFQSGTLLNKVETKVNSFGFWAADQAKSGYNFFASKLGVSEVENTDQLALIAYQALRVGLIAVSLHPSFVFRLAGAVIRIGFEVLLIEKRKSITNSEQREFTVRSVVEMVRGVAEVLPFGLSRLFLIGDIFATCNRLK